MCVRTHKGVTTIWEATFLPLIQTRHRLWSGPGREIDPAALVTGCQAACLNLGTRGDRRERSMYGTVEAEVCWLEVTAEGH